MDSPPIIVAGGPSGGEGGGGSTSLLLVLLLVAAAIAYAISQGYGAEKTETRHETKQLRVTERSKRKEARQEKDASRYTWLEGLFGQNQ